MRFLATFAFFLSCECLLSVQICTCRLLALIGSCTVLLSASVFSAVVVVGIFSADRRFVAVSVVRARRCSLARLFTVNAICFVLFLFLQIRGIDVFWRVRHY